MTAQPTFGQVSQHTPAHAAPGGITAATGTPTTKEIPFDYVARFELKGKRGERTQDVLNISVEGAFVAVAIGYSFIPGNLRPLTDDEFEGDDVGPIVNSGARFQCQMTRLCGIQFKYSIIDSGSGRELQNRPIHNIAGLGESAGHRPFRPFARPALFMPRSTIRIEVEEISEGPLYEGAELHIVLHGYKVLGYGTTLS
jgi:hypothetical protein